MPEHVNARYIVGRIDNVAEEFDLIAKCALSNEITQRSAVMDSNACRAAAALIKELDTEVFRLRSAAASHLQGRMNQRDLRKIIQSWNNEWPTPRPEVPT